MDRTDQNRIRPERETESVLRICHHYREQVELLRERSGGESHVMEWCGALWNLSFSSAREETPKVTKEIPSVTDKDARKEAERIFRKHTGMLSPFRGRLRIPVLCVLESEAAPEDYYIEVQNLYKRLNSGHLLGADYQILGALLLRRIRGEKANWTDVYQSQQLLERLGEEYRFLADQADLPMAIALYLTERPMDQIVEHAEAAYKVVRELFSETASAQSAAQVLALQETAVSVQSERVKALQQKLQNWSGQEEAIAIGLLALLENHSPGTLCKQVETADSYLQETWGEESVFAEAEIRHAYAVALVLETYADTIPPLWNAVCRTRIAQITMRSGKDR